MSCSFKVWNIRGIPDYACPKSLSRYRECLLISETTVGEHIWKLRISHTTCCVFSVVLCIFMSKQILYFTLHITILTLHGFYSETWVLEQLYVPCPREQLERNRTLVKICQPEAKLNSSILFFYLICYYPYQTWIQTFTEIWLKHDKEKLGKLRSADWRLINWDSFRQASYKGVNLKK